MHKYARGTWDTKSKIFSWECPTVRNAREIKNSQEGPIFDLLPRFVFPEKRSPTFITCYLRDKQPLGYRLFTSTAGRYAPNTLGFPPSVPALALNACSPAQQYAAVLLSA